MSIQAIYLDSLNQAFVGATGAQPALENLSIEQFRATIEKLQQHEPIPGVARTSFTVPFEDGIKCYVFKPEGSKGILPVVFFIHGGAWTAGSVNTHDSLCRDIALQTGYAVVFPEHTLAPESHYPTQQEQCYAVVKWVREHGKTKGLLQNVFAIAGDTAGGQLAVAVTILASTRKPAIPISYQVLINPVADTVTTDRETPSGYQFFNGPFITAAFMRKSITEYIPEPADRTSELSSPRNISPKNAAKQPPTLILSASVDILRDDGIFFGEILQKAGVDVCILTGHGQLHDSVLFEATRSGATPKAMMRLMAVQIRDALSHVAENGKETDKRARSNAAEEDGRQLRKKKLRRTQ